MLVTNYISEIIITIVLFTKKDDLVKLLSNNHYPNFGEKIISKLPHEGFNMHLKIDSIQLT